MQARSNMTTPNQLQSIDQMKQESSEAKQERIRTLLNNEVKTLDGLKTVLDDFTLDRDFIIKSVFFQRRRGSCTWVLSSIATEIKTASQLMKLCGTIPEKEVYFFDMVFYQLSPFDHVLSDIAEKIKTLPELMELCSTIPQKRDDFIDLAFYDGGFYDGVFYRQKNPFDHVKSGIAKQIKTAPQLMELCSTIPEKKVYFFNRVFSQLKPFEHVLSDIAKEIKTLPQLVTLCKTIPEQKDFIIKNVSEERTPFRYVLSSIAEEMKTAPQQLLKPLLELCRDFPKGRMLFISLDRLTSLREELLNYVKRAPQSDRETIFQLASELGYIDTIKIIGDSCSEQEFQSLISENNYSAYYLAAENRHFDALTYMENKSSNNLQQMIKAALKSIFLTALKQYDDEMIQHFLANPVVLRFAEDYCNRLVESSSYNFLKAQLEIVCYRQTPGKENGKANNISVLKTYLASVAGDAIKQDEAISSCVNDITAKLSNLLKEFENDKKSLDDLKKESRILLDRSLDAYGNCETTAWLSEQIFTVLRIFFHACDRLQSIVTGEMIDKPNRQQFFRKSLREKSIEMIQKINKEFVAKIDKLETEIKNENSPSGPLHLKCVSSHNPVLSR